jgi:hypothetical protein
MAQEVAYKDGETQQPFKVPAGSWLVTLRDHSGSVLDEYEVSAAFPFGVDQGQPHKAER